MTCSSYLSYKCLIAGADTIEPIPQVFDRFPLPSPDRSGPKTPHVVMQADLGSKLRTSC